MGKSEITKNKIIKASIIEFGAKGYDNASTNAIAKAAGVSKGLVFLHFDNKERLCVECLNYVIASYKNNLASVDFCASDDIFERLELFVNWKNNSMRAYPELAKFLASCYTVSDPPLKNKFASLINEFVLPVKTALFDFDFNPKLYREGITKDKLLNILALIQAGFEQKYARSFEIVPSERIFEEWKEIINAVKYGIMR